MRHGGEKRNPLYERKQPKQKASWWSLHLPRGGVMALLQRVFGEEELQFVRQLSKCMEEGMKSRFDTEDVKFYLTEWILSKLKLLSKNYFKNLILFLLMPKRFSFLKSWVSIHTVTVFLSMVWRSCLETLESQIIAHLYWYKKSDTFLRDIPEHDLFSLSGKYFQKHHAKSPIR